MPFTLRDEDIPDDWSCVHNIWDKAHASCTVPQELTDEEIDNILAMQGVQASSAAIALPLLCALAKAFRISKSMHERAQAS